jgi:glycosyltransferase involved in cell wall biosynthesis
MTETHLDRALMQRSASEAARSTAAGAHVRERHRRPDPLISVVSPVYREEATLRELHLRVLCAVDPHVKVVELSRNFGHQLAITSGLDHAAGDAVIVIDSDLQDPPEVIAEMVARWREGYDVVYGVRRRRNGEGRVKLMTAKWFYRLLDRISETPLPLDAGDFRLLDRQVLDVLAGMREGSRYIRGLVSWIGFDQTAVHYERDARRAGKTNYSLGKMLRLAVDAVTSFSERPLRVAFALGTLVTVVSLALAAWIVVAKLVDPDASLPGYASIMLVVLFFGGVQLLCLGLLGEYVGRIYRETKQRPLYVVRERVNFDESAPPATADSSLRPARAPSWPP